MGQALRQFTTFTGVGAIGTAAHYVVLITLVAQASADPVVASGIGAAVGMVVNYLLNYNLTFRSKKKHVEAFSKFIAVAGAGMGLNLLAMAACVDLLRLHYLVSQVLATSLVLLWNFGANRLWTFK